MSELTPPTPLNSRCAVIPIFETPHAASEVDPDTRYNSDWWRKAWYGVAPEIVKTVYIYWLGEIQRESI